MSSDRPTSDRERLIEEANVAGREISAAAVLFHTAIADQHGLTATDEKALDVLLRTGPLTHAQLVEQTGLAPASVTGLIDRLERKGFAVRRPHPTDRRRVTVHADRDKTFAAMAPLFADWVGELHDLYERYSDEELRTIAEFMREASRRQLAATQRLRDRQRAD